MGAFDDLIPQSSAPAHQSPTEGGGLFDDLVPRIDYDAPVPEVRAAIGKLPAEAQQHHLQQWADRYVAKERKDGGAGQGVGEFVRNVARGVPIVGSFADELNAGTSAGIHALTGGMAGAPYAEAKAYQDATDRHIDANAKKLATLPVPGIGDVDITTSNLTQFAGGLAAGAPLAKMLPTASGMAGNVAIGGGSGAVIGGLTGFGHGNTTEERLAHGSGGIIAGGLIGLAAPPVIAGAGKVASGAADVLSPVTARVGGALQGVRDKLAIRASMSPPPTPTRGADAAAEQVIANQLARANVTPAQLRQRYQDAEEAARFNGNSSADNALAPVDLDPSLQRLAGSAARKHPEVGNLGQAFQAARQTGQPSGLAMPPEANIPTRAPMAPADENVPMGQFERVTDAMKRALGIKDYRAHGHRATAHQTEQAIVDGARTEANQLYGQAYDLGQNVNLRPVVEPIIARWEARMADEPRPVARAIRHALDLFRTENGVVGELQRFDKSKQYLDGVIDKLFTSQEGRNRYLGGVLTELKNEMLGAVDAVPQVGPAYQTARGAFSSQMTARDALRLGRDVFKENAEVGVDHYRQLATDGERKLFRLGLLDSFVNHMGRQKRTADITQIFESPRVQQLLQEVIPRSNRGVFADRPERFGRYVANERKMIGTRNEVFGNSKTAQRLADDESYEMLSSMFDQAKEALAHPSASNIAMRLIDSTLNRLFGLRADTATAIANKLFTANPAEVEHLIQALERRMGPSRAHQFARLMSEHQQLVAQVAATRAAGVSGNGNERGR